MIHRQTILKTALLLTVLALATACSQSKVDTGTDMSSRISPGTTTNTGTASATGLIARCNQKSQGGITANLKVYTDPTTKEFRADYMMVKLIQVPANFASSGGYFEFFRWKDEAGKPSLDTTPTQARFETLDGQKLTDFAPTVSWAQVAQLATNSSISDAATFFRNVRLVVDIRDVNMEFDVLKVAYYSSTNQILNDLDILMPSFYVMPAEYANDHGLPRAPFLQALHPFVSTATSSAEQMKALSESYCF